jgi:dissimilatory sulfite reductase (desulfoviridin) alpha/beta subunit
VTAPTPSIDYVALKSGGIIMQKDDDFYAIRLRLPGGCVSSYLLPEIAQVAQKYDRGEVRLTARAGVEIPWIKFAEIEAARRPSRLGVLLSGRTGLTGKRSHSGAQEARRA